MSEFNISEELGTMINTLSQAIVHNNKHELHDKVAQVSFVVIKTEVGTTPKIQCLIEIENNTLLDS